MKVYDLSKIMKRAHNLYNNARAKYPTFSEALKKSWKMAKFDVQVAEQRQVLEAEEKAAQAKKQAETEEAQIRSILFKAQLEADRIKREAEARAQRMRDEISARQKGISYAEYQGRLSSAMGYGCSGYCGD